MEIILTGTMLVLATINDLINRKIKNIIPFTFIVIGLLINKPIDSLFSLLFSALLFAVLYALPNILKVKEFMGEYEEKQIKEDIAIQKAVDVIVNSVVEK